MDDKSIIREMQSKATLASIEVKEVGEVSDVLHIKAYACAFGNVDSWGDIIVPTACDKFLASEDFKRMALCYQHDTREVIGVINDAGVDEKGMWIEADVLPTTTGKDVQTLIRAGAIKEFSIGYYADEYHFEKREGYMSDIRILDAITIVEVSPVTRAANDKAVLIDAKAEPQETINPIISDIMQENKELEMIQNEAKAAKDAANALAAELKAAQETAEKQTQEINNLDESIKAQQVVIEELKASLKQKKEMTFADALKSALEENKEKIEKLFAEKNAGASVRMDVKMTTANVNAQVYGTQVDTVIGAAPHATRAFLAAFGEEVVNADKAAWLDGTFTNNADYVDELTAAQDSDASANEVIRQFGKIATRLLLSSELNDWMTEIYNWAQTEAVEFINDKVDAEVWNGAGNDTNAKRKIYGLKNQATAFAKIATYANANVGDLILDAVAQAKKNGYAANVAIVSYATEATLKGAKDKSGNPIYDAVKATLGQVQIIPSDKLSDAEMLIADSYCADIYVGNFYELEFSRKASHDAWRVDFRRRAQVKNPAPKAKGIVFVANKATAIEAITKA
jgi:HK97 family phage prohead protease